VGGGWGGGLGGGGGGGGGAVTLLPEKNYAVTEGMCCTNALKSQPMINIVHCSFFTLYLDIGQ